MSLIYVIFLPHSFDSSPEVLRGFPKNFRRTPLELSKNLGKNSDLWQNEYPLKLKVESVKRKAKA